MTDTPEPAPIPDELRYRASESFVSLLDRIGCTLALSVYLQGRVVLVSANAGKLEINTFSFNRPMGMAPTLVGDALRLAIVTAQEVVILGDAPLLAATLPGHPGEFDHLFVPRATLFCGDVDGHELAWTESGLLVANTRFSCIARIDGQHSFTPVWTPPFVTQVMPDDRCHLNGLAVDNGRVAYATAFAATDMPRGWSETRHTSGIVMGVPSGELVLEGLCMPHSPRIFENELYILESGQGRLLHVDPNRHESQTLAELPGFTRGLDRHGDILFVGLSRIRSSGSRRPPIADRHDELVCGIAAIERRSGMLLGYLYFDQSYEEIFDLKVLANVRRAGLLSVDDNGHERSLVLPGRAFWRE